jgi:hypothetical protein
MLPLINDKESVLCYLLMGLCDIFVGRFEILMVTNQKFLGNCQKV